MAGRYLEQFDVTEKAVVTESGARVADERTSPRHPSTAATGAGAARAGSPGRGGEGDGGRGVGWPDRQEERAVNEANAGAARRRPRP